MAMPDTPTPPTPVGVVSPPSVSANKFSVQADAQGVMLTFGITRALFDQGGQVVPIPGVEWLTTIVVSPILADQLSRSLIQGLAAYVKAFGVIPKDPVFEEAVKAEATLTKPPSPALKR
jgi:hypothetical protein